MRDPKLQPSTSPQIYSHQKTNSISIKIIRFLTTKLPKKTHTEFQIGISKIGNENADWCSTWKERIWKETLETERGSWKVREWSEREMEEGQRRDEWVLARRQKGGTVRAFATSACTWCIGFAHVMTRKNSALPRIFVQVIFFLSM